jgi:MoxR-like ATPase
LGSALEKLQDALETQVFGQHELITETLCCLLARGHQLITGAPGLAKTTLIKQLACGLGLKFSRIQFTPDVLPSDIIGSEIFSRKDEKFVFVEGPVFTDLLLADEINRASPRTQSALLEAMAERKVTVAQESRALSAFFMVFATQNPLEHEGTFPLPEAQLDRFMLHSLVDYPSRDDERKILSAHTQDQLVPGLKTLLSSAELEDAMAAVQKITVSDTIIDLILDLVAKTRDHSRFVYGASPRAGMALVSVAKALAFLQGDTQVNWEHVKRLAPAALRHRVRVKAGQDLEKTITELCSAHEHGIRLGAQGLGQHAAV